MRATDRQIVALTNALAERLDAIETPLLRERFPGALTVWRASRQPIRVAEYPAAIYYHDPAYGARFYRHPIDGWVVGLEYEPDDLFPSLIYRSRTAWARDDKLAAAWAKAVDQHKGLWTAKPVKQTGKPNPRDYRQKDSIYVPLERKP